MTLALALRMRERLQQSGGWDREAEAGLSPGSSSEPFWRIPTASYLGFVQANLNKFTAGFEYVRSLGSPDYISWEHSQVMIMFLRLLRFGTGGSQLQREIALWSDERTHRRTGEKLYGLGFSTTVARDGYCWLMPKIDWGQFTFREELAGRSLFGNVYIAETFTARWRAIREAKDDFMKAELLGKWLKAYGTAPSVQRFILWHMRWMCVRHFRKDALSSIESSIKVQFRSDAARARFTLCKENLDAILDSTQPYRLASGNKMAYKDLEDFVDFLWDFDDGLDRKHWAERSYRVLYQRCVKIVEDWCGEEEAEEFMEDVKALFPAVNWIVPYPNHTVFWQHTKQHERMWLSLYHPQVYAATDPGEPLAWRELARAYSSGGDWSIRRGRQAVLEGVPEEPAEAELNMRDVKESILRKWQRHQAGQEREREQEQE